MTAKALAPLAVLFVIFPPSPAFAQGAPPPECTSDDDCAADEACVTQTYESCVGTGCACPDDGDRDPSNDPPCDCPPPSEPACTTETFSFCGPRYLGGCDVDADCGPGFTCEAVETCVCSGGRSGGAEPGAPEEAPPSEDCTCETAGDKSCVFQRVECDVDADCAEGLVCVDETTEAPCAIDSDGNVSCDDGIAAQGTKICVPEGFAEAGGVARPTEDVAAESEGEGGDDGDEDEDEGANPFGCTQGGGRGVLSFLALALLLGRRRR